MARIHLGDFRQNKTTDGISRDEGVAWREKKKWFLYLEKHLDAWMRGIWGHRSDFSTKTLGVQCVIKKSPTDRGEGGGRLSLSFLSLLLFVSLFSHWYTHMADDIQSCIYICIKIYIYYIHVYVCELFCQLFPRLVWCLVLVKWIFLLEIW